MPQQDSFCANNDIGGITKSNKREPDEKNRVAPKDRRLRVIQFLDEHDMALPPLAIFAGMKRQYQITFEYRTIQNILKELSESGDVAHVDTGVLKKEGEIRELDDSSGRRTYYFVTDQGRERLDQ